VPLQYDMSKLKCHNSRIPRAVLLSPNSWIPIVRAKE
jgi:hypothetical protein